MTSPLAQRLRYGFIIPFTPFYVRSTLNTGFGYTPQNAAQIVSRKENMAANSVLRSTALLAFIVFGVLVTYTFSASAQSAPAATLRSTIPNSSVELTMKWIPAGTFMMGSPANEAGRWDDEGPRHSVTLTRGFYMGIYPVTQEQYAAVMVGNANGLNAYPSHFSSAPAAGEVQARRPVEQVSWYDALVFCNRLSILEGRTPVYSINGSTNPANWGTVPASSNSTWNAVTVNWNANGYRLPTEAEWEYACRAGTTTAWYTGNTEGAALQAAAWYSVNSNSRTRQVGLKLPNAYGLYDMHGNVWEWVWNWFGRYADGVWTDPLGPPSSGTNRVLRGGSWFIVARFLRSANRSITNPSFRDGSLGFRVVRP
jgi:formylglycine-generating enzyme required for sulfatase activity